MKHGCLILGIVLLFTTAARADPIRAGSLTWTPDGLVAVTLTSHDLTFTGTTSPVAGAFSPLDCYFSPCARGDRLDLDARWNGSDLPGTVTRAGIVYSAVGDLGGNTSLDAHWLGTMTVRPGLVRAPFTFEGVFSDGIAPLDLSGRGVASARFQRTPGGLMLSSIDYVFGKDAVPNPEPATLVLLATGAAFLWRRATS